MTKNRIEQDVIHETPEQVSSERKALIRLLNPIGRIWLRIFARLLEWGTRLIPSRLNFTWVTDTLAVGGAPSISDYRRLASMGITAVVDTREEGVDDGEALARVGIRLLHLPTTDRYALTQSQLERGARWALERLDEGGRVFVHCKHGVGRGPLLGMAVLVAAGVSAPEALRTVRTRRWQAAPNDRQIEALLLFERAWKAQLARLDSSALLVAEG